MKTARMVHAYWDASASRYEAMLGETMIRSDDGMEWYARDGVGDAYLIDTPEFQDGSIKLIGGPKAGVTVG